MDPKTIEPKVQDYVDAGGLRTYYEAVGAGDPLILLHGGFCTVETFSGLTSLLAERYRVYAPERRAHGRTPDVDGPISYGLMARDTIAFLEALDLPASHLVGWSDGAVVALLVALRSPRPRPPIGLDRSARQLRGRDARGARLVGAGNDAGHAAGELPRSIRGPLSGWTGPLGRGRRQDVADVANRTGHGARRVGECGRADAGVDRRPRLSDRGARCSDAAGVTGRAP